MIEPITRVDADVLTSVFVGAQLGVVTYRYLPPADASGYVGGGEGLDADLAAVVLDLGNRGRGTITWAMDSDLHGISVLGDDSYTDLAAGFVEATSRGAWRGHVGDTITSVGAAWQVSGDRCPESLWALRLDFSAGSVVLALGTDYPEIDYAPDELVVVFDPVIAHAYQPRHVNGSAWGERLES